MSLWAHSQAETSRNKDGTPELSFAEFVVDYQPAAPPFYSASQAWWLRHLSRIDHVIRFDRLLADVLGFPPIRSAIAGGHFLRSMPRLNATQHKPWREYYTPDLERIVLERFEKDFAITKLERTPS